MPAGGKRKAETAAARGRARSIGFRYSRDAVPALSPLSTRSRDPEAEDGSSTRASPGARCRVYRFSSTRRLQVFRNRRASAGF